MPSLVAASKSTGDFGDGDWALSAIDIITSKYGGIGIGVGIGVDCFSIAIEARMMLQSRSRGSPAAS